MRREMQKFTDRLLRSLTIKEGRKGRLVFDVACPGLGVRIGANGTRAFIVQWTDPVTRQKLRQPIGVWGNITIKKAREAARIVLGEVAKGIKPKAELQRQRMEAERQRSEAALTLEVLIDEWAELHLAYRRRRYRTEAVRAIRHAFSKLLNRPATGVTRGDAVNVLDQLVRARKIAMAARTLAYARAAFRWAQRRGMIAVNPFEGLPVPSGPNARERVLSDAELSEVWAAAGKLGYPWGPFFRLTLLTLQRRDAVAGMRWSELSTDLVIWTLSGERMKNGKPHTVHLSEPARAILRHLPRVEGRDLIFSSNGRTAVSGFSKAKSTLDALICQARAASAGKLNRRPENLANWRIHDFRRTGVSTLARLGFDSIVADKILAHQPGKLLGVAAVYQLYDFASERAAALERWAAHALSSENENEPANLLD